MTEATPRVGEQRPGGRAARVRAAVLEAAEAILEDVGYDALSIDDVAGRAGVHKTTVYRRWPTKAELVIDAVRSNSEQQVPIPNTGTLASDLRAFAREVAENISSPGGSLRSRSIVAAAATSDELAAEAYGLWAERFVAASTMIDRAIERGELGASADADLIIEMLIGPLWVRLLLTGKPVTIDHADAAAAFVATALALD